MDYVHGMHRYRWSSICFVSLFHVVRSSIFSKSSLLSHISLGCCDVRACATWDTLRNAIEMQLTCIANDRHRMHQMQANKCSQPASQTKRQDLPIYGNQQNSNCMLVNCFRVILSLSFSIQRLSLPHPFSISVPSFLPAFQGIAIDRWTNAHNRSSFATFSLIPKISGSYRVDMAFFCFASQNLRSNI